MDCVCAIQRVNGQDKVFKCLWMGYGSRCQVHRFVSRSAMLLGFSCSTVSHVFQEWCTSQIWHNCGKHWSQHRPASLWNAFDTLWSPSPNELFNSILGSNTKMSCLRLCRKQFQPLCGGHINKCNCSPFVVTHNAGQNGFCGCAKDLINVDVVHMVKSSRWPHLPLWMWVCSSGGSDWVYRLVNYSYLIWASSGWALDFTPKFYLEFWYHPHLIEGDFKSNFICHVHMVSRC